MKQVRVFSGWFMQALEKGIIYMTKLELLIGIITSVVAVIAGAVLLCKFFLAWAKQCEEDMRRDREQY